LRVEDRKAQLETLLKKSPGVIRYSASFTENIQELLGRARELELEGLIGKRSGSRYEAGKRSGAWIKLKLQKEQLFVIGGYTEPERARKHLGALLVGVYEDKRLKFAGRVGTGFSEKLLRNLSSGLNEIRVEVCPLITITIQEDAFIQAPAQSCSSSLSLSESFPANIRAPLLRFAPSVLSSCGSLTPTVEIMAQPPHV
jgi:ATP-dependent DNA ligase